MIKISNADIDLIISLRTHCVCSWAEIGKRVGLSRRQVEYVYLREAALRGLAKLPRLPRAGAKPKVKPKAKPKVKVNKPQATVDPRRRIPQADKDQIVEDYNRGMDWQDIADRIDDPLTDAQCCRSYIYKRAFKLRQKPKPKPKRSTKRKRRTVSGGCRCCLDGFVSFVLFDNDNRQELQEDVLRKTGTCDSCGTMFRFDQIMDLQSVIAPYLRVTDAYESYVGLRISKMGKQVL